MASVGAPEIGTGAALRCVAFISQNSTWPVAPFQSTRSLSMSPPKSSTPTTRQSSVAGQSASVTSDARVVPFISQMSFWPLAA